MLRRHFGALLSARRLLADPKAGGRSPWGRRKSEWLGHTQAEDCIQIRDLRTGERVSRQQLRYPGPRRFPQRCGREPGDDIVGHPVRHQRRRTGLGAVQMNWDELESIRAWSLFSRTRRANPGDLVAGPEHQDQLPASTPGRSPVQAKPAPREGNIDHPYCMERPARRAGRITATAGHRSRPLALGEVSGRPHSPLTPGLGRRRRHRAACTSIRDIPPPCPPSSVFRMRSPRDRMYHLSAARPDCPFLRCVPRRGEVATARPARVLARLASADARRPGGQATCRAFNRHQPQKTVKHDTRRLS